MSFFLGDTFFGDFGQKVDTVTEISEGPEFSVTTVWSSKNPKNDQNFVFTSYFGQNNKIQYTTVKLYFLLVFRLKT